MLSHEGFKKFRYALEFLRPLAGKPVNDVINDLKAMQDHLGQLNDAHLACDLLSGLLADFESRYQDLPLGVRPDLGGILSYLSSLHSLRRQMAASFPQAWENFTRPEFRQNLALALSEL